MHWVRLITFLIAPMLLALATPVLVLWAWSNDLPLLPALLVGLVFTALALAIHLVGQALPHHDDDLHLLWEEVEHLREAILHSGEHDHPQETPTHQDDVPLPATGPRHAAPPGAHGMASGSSPSFRQQPEVASQPPIMQPAGGMNDTAHPYEQEMRLYMEPVVALENKATVFYRALPALPADEHRIYLGDQAYLRARQQGWLAAFTHQVLQRCITFAQQLKARDIACAVACPLDVTLLDDGAAGQGLLTLLEAGAERSPVMFVVRRENLIQASQHARMQMLMLAQAGDGVVLDMAVPDSNGFFLPAPLPVRYLDVPAARLAEGVSESFMQRLGARGWVLVVSGIDTPDLMAAAQVHAGLGRGRHLSPPRRVRDPHEAATGADQAAHMQQAAMG